jgi:hypothetical protein
VYFVSAFAIKDDDTNESKLEQLDSDLKEMKKMILDQYKQMNEIQY